MLLCNYINIYKIRKKYEVFLLYRIGIIVFWTVELLSIGIGSSLGSGPAEAGIIVSAISALSGIVIICTLIIVDAIKNN